MASFRVKAAAAGFYGKLRVEGEEFDIARKGDLGSWMDPVGWKADDVEDDASDGVGPPVSDVKPKLWFGVKKQYTSATGNVTVDTADAVDAALKAFCSGEDGPRTIEDWNALPQDDRKAKVEAEAKRLLSTNPG